MALTQPTEASSHCPWNDFDVTMDLWIDVSTNQIDRNRFRVFYDRPIQDNSVRQYTRTLCRRSIAFNTITDWEVVRQQTKRGFSQGSFLDKGIERDRLYEYFVWIEFKDEEDDANTVKRKTRKVVVDTYKPTPPEINLLLYPTISFVFDSFAPAFVYYVQEVGSNMAEFTYLPRNASGAYRDSDRRIGEQIDTETLDLDDDAYYMVWAAPCHPVQFGEDVNDRDDTIRYGARLGCDYATAWSWLLIEPDEE